MMDEELFDSSSTLRSTFERATGAQNRSSTHNKGKGSRSNAEDTEDDEVDVDFHLLKNLLESHSMALESNSSGLSPAAILLSHFGIDMPLPPVAASNKHGKNATK